MLQNGTFVCISGVAEMPPFSPTYTLCIRTNRWTDRPKLTALSCFMLKCSESVQRSREVLECDRQSNNHGEGQSLFKQTLFPLASLTVSAKWLPCQSGDGVAVSLTKEPFTGKEEQMKVFLKAPLKSVVVNSHRYSELNNPWAYLQITPKCGHYSTWGCLKLFRNYCKSQRKKGLGNTLFWNLYLT